MLCCCNLLSVATGSLGLSAISGRTEARTALGEESEACTALGEEGSPPSRHLLRCKSRGETTGEAGAAMLTEEDSPLPTEEPRISRQALAVEGGGDVTGDDASVTAAADAAGTAAAGGAVAVTSTSPESRALRLGTAWFCP